MYVNYSLFGGVGDEAAAATALITGQPPAFTVLYTLNHESWGFSFGHHQLFVFLAFFCHSASNKAYPAGARCAIALR